MKFDSVIQGEFIVQLRWISPVFDSRKRIGKLYYLNPVVPGHTPDTHCDADRVHIISVQSRFGRVLTDIRPTGKVDMVWA